MSDHAAPAESAIADEGVGPVRYVNGVFKGGGAKGVAYAGALSALRDRGLWFRSVAGASAGAVTATLIASGMGPEEVAEAVPKALGSAKAPPVGRFISAALGRRSSIFDGVGIRRWMDATLRSQIGKVEDGPVTFAELHRHTGIELYVLAMDLANSHPVVFSRRTTPDVEVAGAVVASSAIPGAFPAGRAVFMSHAHGATVHALVDGGTWANYPSFVFQDRSFRAWLRASSETRCAWSEQENAAWDQESERPVVGFVLGAAAPVSQRQLVGMIPSRAPGLSNRFDRGPTYSSADRFGFLVNLLFSSGPARLMLVAAMTLWSILTLLASSIMARRLSVWMTEWVPDPLYPFALVASLTMVVMAAVIAVGLVVALLLVGRLVADTLVPSMRALIGVPTGVAPWIGMGDDSVVVEVPSTGLSTVGFSAAPETVKSAVAEAHESVAQQLAQPDVERRLEALFRGELAQERPRLDPFAPPPVVFPDRVSLVGALSLVAAIGVIGTLAWWGVNVIDSSGIPAVLGSLALGVVIGGAALVFVGGHAAALANARSRFGVRPSDRLPSKTAMVAAASAGVALLAGGLVLSWVAMEDREDRTILATVTAPDDDGRHRVRSDERAELVPLNERVRLSIGERVFVEVDPTDGTASLVGALDDGRFPVAIVMWLVGGLLLGAAVRRHRWRERCERLAAVAGSLEPVSAGTG